MCPEGQAEAFQRAFSEAVGDSLATKEDIKDLKHDIGNLESKIDSKIERLEHKIEQSEQRITIRLGSIMVIGIAALAAMIKLL